MFESSVNKKMVIAKAWHQVNLSGSIETIRIPKRIPREHFAVSSCGSWLKNTVVFSGNQWYKLLWYDCQDKTVDFVLQLPEVMDVRRPYSQCPVDRPQTPSAERHCICQRPKTALACHKCDFRYVGRVRRTCPAHPRVSADNFSSNSYHLIQEIQTTNSSLLAWI